MIYTVILNTKTEVLTQYSFDNISKACQYVDAINTDPAGITDARCYIVKVNNEPIVDFGNSLEWLDFLEKCKFILAMKDRWSKADFYNDRQLFDSIQAVKRYAYR